MRIALISHIYRSKKRREKGILGLRERAKGWCDITQIIKHVPCASSEKAMAPHSSVLAWRIPGMGEPDGLPSMGSHRVGHD